MYRYYPYRGSNGTLIMKLHGGRVDGAVSAGAVSLLVLRVAPRCRASAAVAAAR